jgi:hypothetical protein
MESDLKKPHRSESGFTEKLMESLSCKWCDGIAYDETGCWTIMPDPECYIMASILSDIDFQLCPNY